MFCACTLPHSEVAAGRARDHWGTVHGLGTVDALREHAASPLAWDGEGKGAGISVYVVDTGVDDVGIFQSLQTGYHAVGSSTRDCGERHGTRVAAIIAGTGGGVAESATIVPVRVIKCDGTGDRRAVLRGLRWVMAHAVPETSIVNLSFSGKRDTAIDQLVSALGDRGIPVVIAAGNSARDTVEFSPTRTGCAKSLSIVVAASTGDDEPWSGSNYGACVSIHAPGVAVRTFGAPGAPVATGTSYAAPYVAGAIAAQASACGITTQDAWRLVLAQAAPTMAVGPRITTTTRRLQLRESCERRALF